MKKAIAVLSLAAAFSAVSAIAQDNDFAKGPIKRVLLISVDGMHAVDFTQLRERHQHRQQRRTLLPGACCPGQDRRQLRRRQHLKTIGFLPRPDLDRHRWKPRPDRHLLRRRLFPEF